QRPRRSAAPAAAAVCSATVRPRRGRRLPPRSPPAGLDCSTTASGPKDSGARWEKNQTDGLGTSERLGVVGRCLALRGFGLCRVFGLGGFVFGGLVMDNPATARILRETADLLEIRDENPFKIRAYRNGADIAANHPHDLARLDEAGLREIPGIGKDLAARIR